jgi:hypothetical protein
MFVDQVSGSKLPRLRGVEGLGAVDRLRRPWRAGLLLIRQHVSSLIDSLARQI